MKFTFRPHIIDTALPAGSYAQTALADLDNDGRLEFIVGQRAGTLFWYNYHTPDRWTRHVLGEGSPSDVGLCVLDVDGDLRCCRDWRRVVSQLARLGCAVRAARF